MMEQGWGRIVNITSQSVRAPIPQLGLSNSARAGLTGYVAGTSRQVAPHGVTINNLLPGIHATDRAISLDGKVAADTGITMDEANPRVRRRSPHADTARWKNSVRPVRSCVHSMRASWLVKTFCWMAVPRI